MKKVTLLFSIGHLMICPCLLAALASQISQYGITWTFDKQYECGQYCNGDWWVTGPVTITKIEPQSVMSDRIINGSMINPTPRNGASQGYDGHMHTASATTLPYKGNLNIARKNNAPLSAANSLTVNAGSSIISTISRIPRGTTEKAALTDAALLTVVAAAPPAGSFRPPYCGTDKTARYNISQITGNTYNLFGKVQPAPGAPTFTEMAGKFQRVWIDHWGTDPGEHYMSASNNQPNYGREYSTTSGSAMLLLNCNYTGAQKKDLLMYMVQKGIDSYGVLTDDGEVWVGMGGHDSGRYILILLAGLVLNDTDMKNLGDKIASNGGPYHFGEIDQTFYVEETSPGVINYGTGGYSPGDIGLPDFGLRHWWMPGNTHSPDQKAWTGGKPGGYRSCCTAVSWGGYILASLIMDIRHLWKHDAIFDYMDRWMSIEAYRQQSQWTKYMWVTHRPKYGCVWKQDNPSDTYSNGQLDCSGCQFNCTRLADLLGEATKNIKPVDRQPAIYNSSGEPVYKMVRSSGVYFLWSNQVGVKKVVHLR